MTNSRLALLSRNLPSTTGSYELEVTRTGNNNDLVYDWVTAASTPTNDAYHITSSVAAGTTFTLTGTGIPTAQADIVVVLNGVTLANGTDYTFTTPRITFMNAILPNSSLEVFSVGGGGQTDFRWNSEEAYTAGNLTAHQFTGRNVTGTITVNDTALVQPASANTPESFILNITGNTGDSSTQAFFPEAANTAISLNGTYSTVSNHTVSYPIVIPASDGGIIISADNFTFGQYNHQDLSRRVTTQSLTLTAIQGRAATTINNAAELATYLSGLATTQGATATTIGFNATSITATANGALTQIRVDFTVTALPTGPTQATSTRRSSLSSLLLAQVNTSDLPVYLNSSNVSAPLGNFGPALTSSITIVVGGISGTLTLTTSLTSKQAIADDFITRFNATSTTTGLRSIFTAATRNTTTNNVEFATIANGDITAMITHVDNSGSIDVVETVTQGTSFTAPVLRVTDTAGTPLTDIIVTGGDTENEIAEDIRAALNADPDQTATVSNNLVMYTGTDINLRTAPVVTVQTQGSSNLVNSFFSVIHSTANAPDTERRLYLALANNSNSEPGLAGSTSWTRINT